MALSTRLFVGNLPDNVDENKLRNVFSSYGDITNFDLKSKPGIESDKKLFAFITISGSNFNIESCIKHFANEEFQGTRLHVTRARESFLERLQREREQQTQKNDDRQDEQIQQKNMDRFSIDNMRNNKRKFNEDEDFKDNFCIKKNKAKSPERTIRKPSHSNYTGNSMSSDFNSGNKNNKVNGSFGNDDKKQNSDQKRLESMKKKRQEFNEKKNIIKFGLTTIDKKPNKKVVFSDNEDETHDGFKENGDILQTSKKSSLFEDEASDDDINFEIKKQFEGKKGQKVLDLQSRYKSDKRFVLDERFVEDESASESEDNDKQNVTGGDKEEVDQDIVELGQADEKSKQLGILQDLLGIKIKPKPTETSTKTKAKLGMLRFDPSQPEHAKYLAPVEAKPEVTKKSKKKKSKDKEQDQITQPEPFVEKVEVSKEQFYKVSDTLKEAIAQPNSFSLRSLFTKDEIQEENPEEDNNYIPIKSKKETKVKNPFESGEKNPFVYDSSESENEEETNNDSKQITEEKAETKVVWREKLFFTPGDNRLKDGLLFFCKNTDRHAPKERRELKNLMKKRIYNKERKNTMFRKKIGGRKKTMKKKFKKG